MLNIALFWLTMLASFFVTRWVVSKAASFGLVHLPNHRSSHANITPHGGGLGVVVAATIFGLCACVLDIGENGSLSSGPALSAVLLLGLVLAAIGLWDDVRAVSARFRLLMQLLVVALCLHQLHPMPAFGALEGGVLLVLLLVAGGWWINLVNFMDGIDGIAAVQGCTMLGSALLLSVLPGQAWSDVVVAQLMLVVLASVLGFLILNWPPARIFLGDVGSTWLAFMILALALVTIRQGWLSYAVWLILAGVFISDATVTLLTRLLTGRKVYEAHCGHAYQKLARKFQSVNLDAGLSERLARARAHRKVTGLVFAVNVFWLLPWAIFVQTYPGWEGIVVALAWAPLWVVVVLLRAGRVEA